MAFLLNEVGKFLPSAAAISAYAKGVGASTTGRALLGMMFGELIQTHLERVGLADINEAPNDGRMANATGEVIFPGVQFSPARVLDDTQTIKRNKVRIYARKIVLDKQIYITPEMNTPDFRQAGQ